MNRSVRKKTSHGLARGRRTLSGSRLFTDHTRQLIGLDDRKPEFVQRLKTNSRGRPPQRQRNGAITLADTVREDRVRLGPRGRTAVDSLYEHSEFRSVGHELFRAAVEGRLTTEQENRLHELGIRT